LIEANAAKLRHLNEAIWSTFRVRHEGAAQMEAWSEACRQFHASYDRLAFPGGLDLGIRRLAQHDSTAIEFAVRFLEADPWFFRSGYIKEEVLKYLRRAPLTDDQKKRLQQVILTRVRDRNTRREFRRYGRLAPAITDPSFEEEVARLAGQSGVIPKQAQWVLARIKQASRNAR
jgi:hypothetical protein